MSESRLTWIKDKPRRICAMNDLGHLVGVLSYEAFNSFTHWVWYQDSDECLTAGLIDEVRAKMRVLYVEMKKPSLQNCNNDKSGGKE